MSETLRQRLMAKTANLADRVESSKATRTPIAEQRPMTMPGQLGAFRLEAQRYQTTIDELTAQLEEARAKGGSVDVPLDQLHEVPGRRRYMPPEKYAELRENLRHNTLIQPVVIRLRDDGGYEIVSGHHRTDAHRDLGRPTVRCVLEQVTQEEADTRAFYANLMQSDLTDYEKYQGFKRLLERRSAMSQAELVVQSGVDQAILSKLMSFENLPSDVLKILADRPGLIGANAAFELSVASKAGRAERVSEAVARLAAGDIDQAQAVRLARAVQEKPKAAEPETVKIKAGRSVYCEMRQGKNVLRLQFQTEEEASAVQEALKTVLEARAQAAKAAAKDS